MQDLDKRLITESGTLSLQIQRKTDEVRSHIDQTILEPWDQKPKTPWEEGTHSLWKYVVRWRYCPLYSLQSTDSN